VTKLGELASHLGYWVVYRNWYGKVSYLIYRWDEHLPVFGRSFPTEEEALEFLAPHVQRESGAVTILSRNWGSQISPVASKIHDVSAVARSSNQVGGACAVMLPMSQ